MSFLVAEKPFARSVRWYGMAIHELLIVETANTELANKLVGSLSFTSNSTKQP